MGALPSSGSACFGVSQTRGLLARRDSRHRRVTGQTSHPRRVGEPDLGAGRVSARTVRALTLEVRAGEDLQSAPDLTRLAKVSKSIRDEDNGRSNNGKRGNGY